MRLYQELHPAQENTAVALGVFDGLHMGHRRVIAEALGGPQTPAVFTFQTDILGERGKGAPVLLPTERKLELLSEMGVQLCWSIPFSAIREMEAEDFVRGVLVGICRARRVCCGFNFHFGKNGAGSVRDLIRLGEELGFTVTVQAPVELGGKPVSSTRIRALLAQGEVEEANRLLGRPFSYDFPVVHGRQLGRTLGFPTVNQPIPDGFILPRFGVYASLVEVDGEKYYGVTNVGVKPTVGSDGPVCETWMPDYHGRELYGETVRTELHGFVRSERRFPGLYELREQIFRDRETAKKIIYKL